MSAYRMDHGHYEWSPVVTRPPLRWPHGARVAVMFVISLGHFEQEPPDGSFDPLTHLSPLRVIPYPDYPTVTHREYGHRIGIFRIFELFDAHGVRATAAIDAHTAERYPGLVEECRRRGWEVMAHGLSQRRAITAHMSEAEERAYIDTALSAVAGVTGVRPAGWLSPEQSESARTPTLLSEAGVQYFGDWANDEQPYLAGPTARPLVSIPVMRDLGDVGLHWNRHIAMPRWSAIVREAFDTLYREGEHSGRLFTVPLHPWCIGQPFRVKYLDEVLAHVRSHGGAWVTTGSEISAWYREQLRSDRR